MQVEAAPPRDVHHCLPPFASAVLVRDWLEVLRHEDEPYSVAFDACFVAFAAAFAVAWQPCFAASADSLRSSAAKILAFAVALD